MAYLTVEIFDICWVLHHKSTLHIPKEKYSTNNFKTKSELYKFKRNVLLKKKIKRNVINTNCPLRVKTVKYAIFFGQGGQMLQLILL